MNSNTTVDDVDPHVVYSTTPAWNTGVWSGQEPQPLFGTNHGTPNPGAVATFTFDGTAVYVYGYKASDHGYRDVSVDGASPVTCDGRTGSQGSRALVYWAEGLSPGTHDITLKHTGTQGQYLNIDYFLVTGSGGDSTATIAGGNPAYTSTQNNNTQSSSSIGIIVGIVAAAAVISLLAVVWFLWRRRRKARLYSEKTDRADLDSETTRGTRPMPVIAGTTPDPRIIEPFYAPLLNPGKAHPNATPTFNPQNRQPYSDSSSAYYSQAGPQSQSAHSSAPSGYSPPPNQTQFAPLHLHAPSTTAGTSAYASSTTAEVGSAPWATSSLGETASGTSRKRVADPSISKARYSGANSLSASSTSRPLSPPTIDDSVPPPQYEL